MPKAKKRWESIETWQKIYTISLFSENNKRALVYAKNRVHVRIAGKKIHAIPDNVLDENREWIEFACLRYIYPSQVAVCDGNVTGQIEL